MFHAYLDIKYDPTTPVGQSYIGFTSVQKAYEWSPLGAAFDEDDVVGMEAPLWTETVDSREDIDMLAFPRLCGHAEVGWSGSGSWEEYRGRLARHGRRLAALGVGFYRSPLVDWIE